MLGVFVLFDDRHHIILLEIFEFPAFQQTLSEAQWTQGIESIT